MRKIFCMFLLILLSFSLKSELFAWNELKIISRSEWGANEEYRYIDSKEWKDIIKKENINRKNQNIFVSQADTIKYLQKPDLREDIEKYLFKLFWKKRKIESVSSIENGRELFWPIARSEQIQWLVVHHTVFSYNDMYEWVRAIYKYHTITNGWWDVWYNYLIGKNWEIFEWRAWGEKVIWAHNKWNNIWNIWIALIWDYANKEISDEQEKSLNKLMTYLIEKYDINLSKKVYFHKQCDDNNCDNIILSQLLDPIIGHRDAWHTTCPGEKLYIQLQNIRKELIKQQVVSYINKDKLISIFNKYNEPQLRSLYSKLHIKIKLIQWIENSNKKIIILNEITVHLATYLEEVYL
jgi:hypothetical protein